MLLLDGVSAGQQTPPENKRAPRPRRHAVLNNAPELLKAVEEPALRVFLRTRAAKFLWAEKSPSASQAAEAMAAAAMADIRAHRGEAPALYDNLLLRELTAALETNAPALAARLRQADRDESNGDQLGTAYELSKNGDGAGRALEIARRQLRSGRDPSDPQVIFLLSRLDEIRPEAATALLAEILSTAEHALGDHPVTSLFTLAHQYLYGEATPPELKARFLAVLINSARNPAALSEGERVNAFNLLKANLRAIEQLLPQLYPQAGAEVAALSTFLPREAVERAEAYNSIRGSAEPFEQTLSVAEKTQDTALKKELLLRAAQMAMDRGRLKQAVDLLLRGEAVAKTADPAQPDQFLAEVAQKAAEKKDADALSYAEAKIVDPLRRALAVQRLAMLYYDAQDIPRAQDTLDVALKLAQSADDDARKATTMLTFVNTFLKVDDARAPELTQAAIKIINNLPTRKPDEKQSGRARQQQTEMLIQVAYYLPPVFERLVAKDELGAFSAADTIREQGLRAAAILGASMGLDRIEAKSTASSRGK